MPYLLVKRLLLIIRNRNLWLILKKILVTSRDNGLTPFPAKPLTSITLISMRTKIYLVTLLIAFVTIFGLTACMNEDEPKDITKEVTMYVSSETGIMYDLFDSEGEFPIECMLVKEQGEDEYRPLAFCGIQGFEYEKGYEYDLRVNKTTLANPPADGSIYKYQLVRVVEKRQVGNPNEAE